MAEKDVGLIHTTDSNMQKILTIATNVAASRATILIFGESGTGKEVLARFIHAKSQRSHRRLVAVNCAAVPENLLESELFGYEKGAFTGATSSKPGKFEVAHESTFLLDEISEMPLLLQAKLLRVIQEGEVERLGARQPIKVNVRLIATTNRDLLRMVKDGQFREDLYYRLNVLPLCVPRLRDRISDIEFLARQFLEKSARLNDRTTKGFSPEASQKLLGWSWPGNVRELENVIERSVLLTQEEFISADELLIEGFQESANLAIAPGMTLAEVERRLILATLESTGQNRTRAARLLDISIRTLRNKLHEYGTAPTRGESDERLVR